MRRYMLLGALGVTGCQTPFGFGGDDWQQDVDDPIDTTGGSETTDTSLDPMDDATGPSVLASHAWCAEGEPTGIASLVDGDDVWITHVGFSEECCADWYVGATAVGNDVTIDYTNLSEEVCDCDCAVYGIEYVMAGFTSGRWTVSAGGDRTSFDFGLETE